MADLLITNGTVVDGTGNPGYRAAVAIEGDTLRIVRGTRELPEAQRTIDATGLTVCPGFFDLHSHSALIVQSEPDHFPKVQQGVTTEVIGIDGNSYAPFKTREQLTSFVRMYAGLDGHPDDIAYDWDSTASLLRKYDRRTSVNIATMVGNAALRLSVVGWDMIPATPGHIADMKAMLREAMQEGAFGLSTGLDYPPGSYASTDELIELAQAAGEFGGFYHTHLRNTLGDRFLDPIREAVTICRRGELPLHLTHLFHRANSPYGAQRIFDLITEAQGGGVEVTFDSYPYEWGSTTAIIKLPQWAQEGGPEATVDRLTDTEVRERIRKDIAARTSYAAWIRSMDYVRLGHFSQPSLLRYEGLTLGEIVRTEQRDAVDVFCDILVAERLAINEVAPGPWPVTLAKFVTHPEGMVGTDSIFLGDKPSPRTYGAYPRILGDLVREEKLMSLAEAIRKMTSYPAQRLGVLDRGILRDGLKADVTIFDFNTIRPVGTYDDPRHQCEGVHYVINNGVLVIDQGVHTGAHPGRALRRKY
ncbi:N-acyl-D-amino-acid deacylase family protein [Tsukamurella soli]|uniref:D-aminoacylase n=1 Tax=Tsukamurella soli TaxID=644556 RepID=A0ABP8JE13_9ACTN